MSSKPRQSEAPKAGLKTVLEPEEVQAMIDAAPTLRDKVMIRFLAYSGVRVSEMLGVRADQIDFDRGVVLIEQLKQAPRKQCPHCGVKVGRRHRFCPQCGASVEDTEPRQLHRRRLLSLDRRTLSMMRDYLQRRQTVSPMMMPLTRQSVDMVIKDVAERAGLGGVMLLNPEASRRTYRRISAHAFRAGLAVRWLQHQDTPTAEKALQQHLGHIRSDTTRRYVKLTPETQSGIYREIFDTEEE